MRSRNHNRSKNYYERLRKYVDFFGIKTMSNEITVLVGDHFLTGFADNTIIIQIIIQNSHTGCSIWIATKVNKYCDHVFRVRHFSLQIYAGNMCIF